MSAEALAIAPETTEKNIYESLALRGDISGLGPQDKAAYLKKLCDSLGMNPYTQPFIPLKLNGKEVLYASRGATDQLASVNKLTREIIKTERIEDVYVATCKVTAPDGRFDISTGAVTIGNLKGDNLANALMKAETKAKRRATLSFCGLGFLDESELETIPAERIEYPKTPTKGQLTEASKQAVAQQPAQNADLVFTAAEGKMRDEIKDLMSRLGMSEANVLGRFDANPEKRELGLREVRKAFVKNHIQNLSGEGLNSFLDKHGIVTIEEATDAALERAVEDIKQTEKLASTF